MFSVQCVPLGTLHCCATRQSLNAVQLSYLITCTDRTTEQQVPKGMLSTRVPLIFHYPWEKFARCFPSLFNPSLSCINFSLIRFVFKFMGVQELLSSFFNDSKTDITSAGRPYLFSSVALLNQCRAVQLHYDRKGNLPDEPLKEYVFTWSSVFM